MASTGMRQDVVVKAWKSSREPLTSAGAKRGALYLLAGTVLAVSALVAVAPEQADQAAVGIGRFFARFWLALLLASMALLLAVTARTGGRGNNAERRRLPPLVPLLVHVALLLGLALAIGAGVGALLWAAVGRPPLAGTVPKPGSSTAPVGPPPASSSAWTPINTFDAMKIVLAVVGGIGGVVALTIAYRRQHLGESAEHREEAKEERENTKFFNERFAKAVDLLGGDKAAVRLAGVYAVAGLADDWRDGRQMCVDVLCAYLRMPYSPPADDGAFAAAARRTGLRSAAVRRARTVLGTLRVRRRSEAQDAAVNSAALEERQVRHTVIKVVTDHLRLPGTDFRSWQGLDFDFSGAVFDGGDFEGANFSGGTVIFQRAQFRAGTLYFHAARFSGATVYFNGARFSGSTIYFHAIEVSAGAMSFDSSVFSGGAVYFDESILSGGTIRFSETDFAGGHLSFGSARFCGSTVDFGGDAHLGGARFLSGGLYFGGAEFSSGKVTFGGAEFLGGTVDFSQAGTWTSPPGFPDRSELPPGLHLPRPEPS